MLRIPRQIWFWPVADSTYNLRIPLAICGFHLQLRIPQQLNLTIQMSYHLFVDSTNCSAFRKHSCRFLKIACFLSTFERYNGNLGFWLWIPKQQRVSEKSSNVADSATNLILACCGFHLQFADSTCSLRVPHFTVADSATAQFTRYKCRISFVCAFHKLFCNSAIHSCRCLKIACFWAHLSDSTNNDLGFWLWIPKQQRVSEKSSRCCGFRDKPDFGLLRIEHLQWADFTYMISGIPLTVCGFRNSSI